MDPHHHVDESPGHCTEWKRKAPNIPDSVIPFLKTERNYSDGKEVSGRQASERVRGSGLGVMTKE